MSIELVPGEEDCVTLGTLTSVARGHTADACVVLEPTEGLPRNASRPGLRFEIACRGVAVHGTVKWLGRDAIALATAVLGVLPQLEAEWNDRRPTRCSPPTRWPGRSRSTPSAAAGGRAWSATTAWSAGTWNCSRPTTWTSGGPFPPACAAAWRPPGGRRRTWPSPSPKRTPDTTPPQDYPYAEWRPRLLKRPVRSR